MDSTDKIDALEDNTSSADNAALPARLARLTTAEKLDAAVAALGAATVRPILEEGDGFCEAAAALRDGGPWWRLLSDVLEELCRHDAREAWELLFSTIETLELIAPLELDDQVCTVDSLLRRQDSPLGRHLANTAAELEDS